jgi:hypothetical protein
MALTQADWKKIYAKAHKDQKFRSKLESDPTAAIREYHIGEHGKEMAKDAQIVELKEWLEKSEEGFPPPACC